MQDDSTQATSWGQQPSSPQGGQQPPPQQPSQQWGQQQPPPQPPPQQSPQQWGQQLPPQQQPPPWSQQQSSQQQSPQWGKQGQTQQPPWGPPPPSQQQSGPPLQTQPSRWAQQLLRSSRRLLWIILAIVGVVVILAIASVAFLSRSSVGSIPSPSGPITSSSPPATVVTTTGADSTATQYYQAIQSQNYQKAYSFLSVSTLKVQGQNIPATEQLYVRLASGVDTARGKVSSFAIKSTSPSNGSTNITMTVTRNGQSYDVHLVLQQSGTDWKIVAFDQI